ncbi:MAG: YceI family protein [Bacteroidota bacterium]
MKSLLISVLFVATLTGSLRGQGKYLTNRGQIIFYSHTAIEDITAENNKVASVIDAASGEVAIIVKMTDFQFEKKMMQEHFNENYVESEKFPKAVFNGKILNNADVKYASKGIYQVQVEGEMTIHGKTNQVSAGGTIEVDAEGIVIRAKFMLNPEDYDITIPNVVRKNIAEALEIRVEINHLPI